MDQTAVIVAISGAIGAIAALITAIAGLVSALNRRKPDH